MSDTCIEDMRKPEGTPARRIEVFTGAGRRRRWSAEEKAAIVAESYAGTDTASGVARRYGLTNSQLFVWRRATVRSPSSRRPGGKTFFHQDKTGSVVATSDASGAIAKGPYAYDPYGKCTSGGAECGDGDEPYKYTGRRYDPETGLYYYRARYYSAAIGRFLQTDPVGYTADLNLYAYVGNDPMDKTDPTGLTGNNSTHNECDDTAAMCVSIKMPGNIRDAGSNGDQKTKTDNLSNVVENETSSLKVNPNAKTGLPGSAEDLAAGRLAVAEIANRVIDAGHPDRVASSTLYDSEAAGHKRGDPAAVDAHNASRAAAQAALNGSNTTNGATQYRTRVGSNVTTPLGKSKTNPGTEISMHFGPFY